MKKNSLKPESDKTNGKINEKCMEGAKILPAVVAVGVDEADVPEWGQCIVPCCLARRSGRHRGASPHGRRTSQLSRMIIQGPDS